MTAGIAGHALTWWRPFGAAYGWYCTCDAYMGRTRDEARRAMAAHRLDLRSDP